MVYGQMMKITNILYHENYGNKGCSLFIFWCVFHQVFGDSDEDDMPESQGSGDKTRRSPDYGEIGEMF